MIKVQYGLANATINKIVLVYMGLLFTSIWAEAIHSELLAITTFLVVWV